MPEALALAVELAKFLAPYIGPEAQKIWEAFWKAKAFPGNPPDISEWAAINKRIDARLDAEMRSTLATEPDTK